MDWTSVGALTVVFTQRWAPAHFSRFRARERESAKKEEREKSESTGSPVLEPKPLGRGGGVLSKIYSTVCVKYNYHFSSLETEGKRQRGKTEG